MDHLCYICLVFFMLWGLFIAALLAPAVKGARADLLVLVLTLNCVSLSCMVSWVKCGA